MPFSWASNKDIKPLDIIVCTISPAILLNKKRVQLKNADRFQSETVYQKIRGGGQTGWLSAADGSHIKFITIQNWKMFSSAIGSELAETI